MGAGEQKGFARGRERVNEKQTWTERERIYVSTDFILTLRIHSERLENLRIQNSSTSGSLLAGVLGFETCSL